MTPKQLQQECEVGAEQLMRTEYRAAAATLARAEAAAWAARDFDTLARVSLPLQEAQRLTRQRCGEGTVYLAPGTATPDQLAAVADCRHGQVAAAGRASIAPGLAVRERAAATGDYVEAFLAAAFPTTDGGEVVALVPLPETPLPDATPRSRDDVRAALPPTVTTVDFPPALTFSNRGTAETFMLTMLFWEQLHEPFLAAAVAEPDPLKRIELCRVTIRVDPACELAYQYMADAARECRRRR